MLKIIFVITVLTLSLPQIQSDEGGSIIEDGVYALMKNVLEANGYPKDRASCVVDVLRFQGATDDVANMKNILNLEQMYNKLKAKAQFADSLCQSLPVIFGVVVLAFGIIFCCICYRCCCSSRKQQLKETTVVLSLPFYANNPRIPYEKVDNV